MLFELDSAHLIILLVRFLSNWTTPSFLKKHTKAFFIPRQVTPYNHSIGSQLRTFLDQTPSRFNFLQVMRNRQVCIKGRNFLTSDFEQQHDMAKYLILTRILYHSKLQKFVFYTNFPKLCPKKLCDEILFGVKLCIQQKLWTMSIPK
jgi:hypothetical protein